MGKSFVTVAETTEKRMAENKKEEKSILPSSYGCEIVLEKTSIEKSKDPSFPSDAYLIWYNIEDNQYIDLVRGTRVCVFDMYHDKYGPNAVKRIDFGYGRTNPRVWGYKQPDKKKRR